MSLISSNLQAVRSSIETAARKVSRDPHEVSLLAVSKTFGADAVLEAVRAGQTAFGENYLQEALDKIAAVHAAMQAEGWAQTPAQTPTHATAQTTTETPAARLSWHFIGPIQSNKTRPIAEQFDWVHSVDREKIAQRLSAQRPAHLPPLNVCLQVNISGEASKSGVLPQQVAHLARAMADLPRLTLRGLMAVPEPAQSLAEQRKPFSQLRELLENLNRQGLALDTLSMGMTADMDAAIAEGATIVRVGTAIFGSRNYE